MVVGFFIVAWAIVTLCLSGEKGERGEAEVTHQARGFFYF